MGYACLAWGLLLLWGNSSRGDERARPLGLLVGIFDLAVGAVLVAR